MSLLTRDFCSIIKLHTGALRMLLSCENRKWSKRGVPDAADRFAPLSNPI